MATNIDNKCKQCRREGQKLFLKGERCNSSKCAIIKRNYAPGLHGNKRKVRLTGYGIQLREKQKAKKSYGLFERQFNLYYKKAKSSRGKTGEVMLQMLEKRLDNVIYKAGFASSRAQARQLVSHSQFQLNGRSINIPSIQVKAGDVIKVKDSKKISNYWNKFTKESTSINEIPAWLKSDKAALVITVTQMPTVDLINSDLQMHLIVELYSL